MTPEDIIAEVALVTGVPAPAITGQKRSREIVYARFIAIAAVREQFSWWTLRMTADFFHRRDHGTIIHACRQHIDLLNSDRQYKAHAREIFRNLFACQNLPPITSNE